MLTLVAGAWQAAHVYPRPGQEGAKHIVRGRGPDEGSGVQGPREVSVEDVPDAMIEHPADAVLRITTTNICGSDLHMYEGRTNVEEGTVLGHENMGIVEQVGPACFFVKKGDRVSVPFNIACGVCTNCQTGWTSYCTNTNPTEGVDGAAYGYANMGNLVQVVRSTGAIGVVGVYVPEDPGADDEKDQEGRYAWNYGQFFQKGQRMGTGQYPVKRYNRGLRDLIVAGRAEPSFIVSHELSLAEAPEGYSNFDERNDGWTKVLLRPAA